MKDHKEIEYLNDTAKNVQWPTENDSYTLWHRKLKKVLEKNFGRCIAESLSYYEIDQSFDVEVRGETRDGTGIDYRISKSVEFFPAQENVKDFLNRIQYALDEIRERTFEAENFRDRIKVLFAKPEDLPLIDPDSLDDLGKNELTRRLKEL